MECVSRDGFALALAVLPIAWLVIALAVIKLKAWQATFSAAALAIALSLAFFSDALPAAKIPGVVASGVAFALCPICLLVFAALFTYAVTVESGAMGVIRAGLGGISNDRRVIALLIAWAFGNFMEGMAGFGSAVAIPAAMLVGMGFDPVKSVLMCLVANTTPTAFGSVGVPLTTLATESGSEVMSLAWTTALLQCVIQAACPVLVLLVLDGFRALKGMWRMLLLVDAAFLVPWLLTAKYIGCELPNVIGGLCAMMAIGLSCRRGGFAGAGAQLRAWAPFGLVVAILGVNAVIPASTKAYLTPGALVLVAGFTGGLAQRVPPKRLFAVIWRTAAGYWPAFATICFVLALARVMGASGMTSTMAAALVSATGDAYPFASAAVGALGGFVTGSGTSSSVLFARLQVDAAVAISVSPKLLAAANIMGAGIGKMICPQSIAIGAAAAGLKGAESGLFKAAFPWFIGVMLAASALTGLAAKLCE
jgi:lactate permease